MRRHIRPALIMLLLMTVLTGILYPLGLTGLAQLIFPDQAGGSLITRGNTVIGSQLIGQNFTSDRYFHGRPSATTAIDPNDPNQTIDAPYNAANSSGSNLAPTSKVLLDRVTEAGKTLGANNDHKAPVDLVTSSASGLDPDITPAAAYFQIRRVARARVLSEEIVRQLVEQTIQFRDLGIFGEKRVNVLALNLKLDAVNSGAEK